MIDITVYLFSLISLLFLFAIFYVNKSILIFIPIVLGVLYYFPAFFDVFYGNYQYSDSVVRSANLFALYVNFNLICCAFFMYSFLHSKDTVLQYPVKNNEGKVLKIFSTVQILSFLFLIYAVYLATNGNILSYSWATKHEVGEGGIFFLISSYLFIVSSGVVFISWYLKYKKTFILSLVIVVLYIVVIRSRGFIVPVLMVFGLYFLIWKRKIFSSFLLGFLFLFLFFALQQVRYLGELSNVSDVQFNLMVKNIVDKIMSEDSEFSLRNSFYFFIQNSSYLFDRYSFGEFQTYRRIVFFFDAFNLGLKPKDFTNTMYNAYYGNNILLSNPTLHPTMYGSIYANGMYISSLVFTTLFSILVFIDKIIREKGFLIYWLVAPIFLYCCIFIARGSIYNAILILAVNIFLIFIFMSIKKFKFN